MVKKWKKCPNPKYAQIHPNWFTLDYFFSEYSVYCLSDNCIDYTSICSINGSEDSIGQYVKDTKIYYSTDNGKTKKIVEISSIPCSIEFLTLLMEERIKLFGQKTSNL